MDVEGTASYRLIGSWPKENDKVTYWSTNLDKMKSYELMVVNYYIPFILCFITAGN